MRPKLDGLIERGDFAAAERFLERYRDTAWHDRDHAQLARRMPRLGDVQTKVPWAYVGPGAFRAARRAARAA